MGEHGTVFVAKWSRLNSFVAYERAGQTVFRQNCALPAVQRASARALALLAGRVDKVFLTRCQREVKPMDSNLEKRERLLKALKGVLTKAEWDRYSREELLRRVWPPEELKKLMREIAGWPRAG